MAFNITEIVSAINNNGGLAKPNMFFVRITPPQGLVTSPFMRDVMYFCDATQLPGLNYSSTPVRSVGYGTVEQRPIDTGFTNLNTTFIVGANGRALRFFQQWLALINNWSRETTGVMKGSTLAYGEWNYPSTYEGVVEIHALNPTDPTGKEIVVYELSKAFPIQVGDISVAWELNDTIMRLPVVFAYNTWNTKNVPPSLSETNLDPASSSGQTLSLRTNQYSYGLSLLANGSPSLSDATYFANFE